jgi:hypothetical protein
MIIDPKIDEMSKLELTLWLDNNIDHRDITQAKSQYYISRTLEYLVDTKGIPLEKLLAAKFYLAKAIANRINEHRNTARKQGYQAVISESNQNLVVEEKYSFPFNSDLANYPVNQVHDSSRYIFKKAFLRSSFIHEYRGRTRAIILDSNPNVKCWIRKPGATAQSSILATNINR